MKLLFDVVGVTVSRGHLRNVCAKVADSLDGAYEELLGAVTQQAVRNVDETGHKEYAQRMWTWCFRAATFTLFKIDPSRSSEVLIDVLGEEFKGVLGCDYFSAYRKYMDDFGVLVQFCLCICSATSAFWSSIPTPAIGPTAGACSRRCVRCSR